MVEIKVADVWKGKLADKVSVLTGMHDGNCGYTFKVGEETYLVYALNIAMYTDVRSLTTHICTRTAPLSEAQTDLKFLGKRRKP